MKGTDVLRIYFLKAWPLWPFFSSKQKVYAIDSLLQGPLKKMKDESREMIELRYIIRSKNI